MQRVWVLVWKEILQVWRDPKSRLAVLLPPIIQLVIFAYAATLDVKNVPIGILNLDQGLRGHELIERFRGAPIFSQIVYLKGMEEVGPFLDNQKGIMVISIDEPFSRLVESKQKAFVQLLLDGRRSNAAQIVAGYAQNILGQYNADICGLLNIKQQNSRLVARNWYNPNLLYHWYNIASLVVVLTMVISLNVTALSVARERELGTFDQLLVSPLLPAEILIGKMVPGILIGLFEGAVIMSVGIFAFGVPFTGSLLILAGSLLTFILSIVGAGLFISSLAMTQQQAILGNFIFIVPSIILSGYATPVENMPSWLQPVSSAIPLSHMLIISKGLFFKAMPLRLASQHIWPMLVVAGITLPGAAFFFRRHIE